MIYWIVCILVGSIYPLLCFGFRRTLKEKRLRIEQVIGGGLAKQYAAAYGQSGETGASAQILADSLVDRFYHWRSYVLPASLLAVLTFAASVFCFAYVGIPMGLPTETQGLVQRTPNVAIVGLAGAFLWGLSDILSRFRTGDLSATSLHSIWLRLLIAPIVGALAGASFVSPIDLIAAFGIGAFPVHMIEKFLRARAEKSLPGLGAETKGESPSLHHVQGLRASIIDRLAEEGISSTEHLANADPIRLLLRTSIEWKTILDIIDGAILFNYLGEKASVLRTKGIRTAIELAELGDKFKPPAGPSEDWPPLIRQIAASLEETEDGVWNLVTTLYDDVQVNFIWKLWGEETVEATNGQVIPSEVLHDDTPPA